MFFPETLIRLLQFLWYYGSFTWTDHIPWSLWSDFHKKAGNRLLFHFPENTSMEKNSCSFIEELKFTIINSMFKKQGSANAYILAYALVHASNNLGMCTDNLLLNRLPFTNFKMPLLQYLLRIYLWYQSNIFWKNISLNISLKYISEKVFLKRSLNISIYTQT